MAEPDRKDPLPPPPEGSGGGARTYNIVADKVGLVPNIRMKDNLLQALATLIFTGIGALVGFLVGRSLTGLFLGVGAGLVAGLLLSGGVLMIVGLFRKS